MAEVRGVFRSGSSRVAGCLVTDGKVVKDCGISVLRKGKEVTAGVLGSLRRVKEIVEVVSLDIYHLVICYSTSPFSLIEMLISHQSISQYVNTIIQIFVLLIIKYQYFLNTFWG